MTLEPLEVQLEIRQARIEDYERLCRLWRQVDDYHARIRPDFFASAAGSPRTSRYLQKILEDTNQRLLVAEREEHVLGIVQVQLFVAPPDPRNVQTTRGHVEDLVVDESCRRQGIGRALMEAATRWCQERGATKLVLTVWRGNKEAQAFYEQLGYEPVCQVLGRPLCPLPVEKGRG